MARNLYQDKVITKFMMDSKVKDSHGIRSAKVKDKKPMSNQRRFRSNKSINIRSLSETNDSQSK
jgi:hypothetical protein